MSWRAERRIIMDNFFNDSISIEKFAAFLDGNLSESEMSRVENIVMQDPELSELVDLSDSIDQDIQDYVNDDFLFEADMSMLDESEIEIPTLDLVMSANIDLLDSPLQEVACASADINEVLRAEENLLDNGKIEGIDSLDSMINESGNKSDQKIHDPSHINFESEQETNYDSSALDQDIFSPGE